MAASVGAAVQWIGTQLVEEAKYLHEVEEKVEELQDELRWMACFLQDVDAKRDRDARMREWIRQISWLAYQSEDIIETFILKFEFRRHGGLLNQLKRYSCIIREAMALHEFRSDIDALKLKISTLTSRLHTYGVRTTEEGSSSSVKIEQQRKSYAHYVEDENIIGLENDVKDVVKKLKAEEESRTVAIYGVGGLGKTTLAKKVYHHKDIRQYFEAFAWASISQQCDARSVLAELLRGLTSNKAGDNEKVEDLMERVYKVQQEKKCLVVLDDIWDTKAWDSLKEAFPFNQENSSDGKVVLTTRIRRVANYVDNNAYVHELTLMTESSAWALLQKKIGGDPPHIVVQKHGPEAEKLAREMLKHCGGLPLAIAALGGILAAKKSLEEWKVVQENIKRLLPNAKEGGLSCEQVLSLSYYDLPFHLKPCFLYLGIFPEDSEIPATKLIQLWMAEGFLSTNISDSKDYIHQQGSSLEELGESYLAELVDRSMVQVGSTRWNGTIKTCRIHDLVRELCISKAAEENLLKVLTVGDLGTSSSSISRKLLLPPPPGFTSNIRKRYRRLVVHCDKYDLLELVIGIVSSPNKKSNAQEGPLFGLDNDVEAVVNKLKSDESNIVALCGVGGLGKTTLAKKVYHHKDVRQYFNAFAWASISQQCDVRGVLTKLIQDLTSEKVSKGQEDEFLKDKLCKVQQEKKCLVVLDDIWYDYTWDSLRHAFQNPLVGKLMFTTRKQSVAKYADGKALIHEQEFMNEKDAQQLLKKKLPNDPSNIFGPEHGTHSLAPFLLIYGSSC